MKRRISDKQRLDWLLGTGRYRSKEWRWMEFMDVYYSGKENSPRKVIDAAMKAASRGSLKK